MTAVRLRAYREADLALTLALETDPVVTAELGGPRAEADLRRVHVSRLAEPWWLVVADAATGDDLGTVGVWATEHGGGPLHEIGWMVLPAAQGRGVASAAVLLLLDRVRAAGGVDRVHAYPAETNGASNRLCEKLGFARLEVQAFDHAGRTLRCVHWALAL